MEKVDFPSPLKELLEDSELQAPLRALADKLGDILKDNKLAFFPDYTDHGIDHVNRVLKAEVSLIPADVWAQSHSSSAPRLLTDVDAAVIIGATLLHDIAMHLSPSGFMELIQKDSRFRPLAWFRENQEGHLGDSSWYDLWQDFVREARRLDEKTLINIVGEASVRNGWRFQELPTNSGEWERNHCLIIGEFLRRHHSRLGHEVAIYGFPGLPVGANEGQFPSLGAEEGHPLKRLADLIGLTARSHGMSLRVCKAYLDGSPLYPGTPKPMGTAVLYPMALLRVADYLQIDRQRAPAVLLQLRNPQSPISLQEWEQHLAVQSINPATDPRGKMVTVSNNITLHLYLQLQELLDKLQAEIDHSTAVLGEVYGTRTDLGLHQLGLATRRVYSNLQSPAFRASLPYVPRKTGFTADPNLFTLLVEPLYGKQPSVGVRELIQNAVDAVSELRGWNEAHDRASESISPPDTDGDVFVDFFKREDTTWMLRVRDQGIGMRSETIEQYFLRAGASFRYSAEWAKDFLNEDGKPRILRAGRFGIGAFAVFLMGRTFRLSTRHVGAERAQGYSLQASADSLLIEIRRTDHLPVGTTVEVELSPEAVAKLALDRAKPGDVTDWFCWCWPIIKRRVISDKQTIELTQEFAAPIPSDVPSPGWMVIRPDGFDAVWWTFSGQPPLVCNGLRIDAPDLSGREQFDWPDTVQLRRPCIAVVDNAGTLPLTIQRYGLSRRELPFTSELVRDVALSFIAYALVCGPEAHISTLLAGPHYNQHPLSLGRFSEYEHRMPDASEVWQNGLLRWCSTPREFVPLDPWLFSTLKAKSFLIYGSLDTSNPGTPGFPHNPLPETSHFEQAVICWDANIEYHMTGPAIQRYISCFVNALCSSGVATVDRDVVGARIVVSVHFDLDLHLDDALDQRKITSSGSTRRLFEVTFGEWPKALPLEAFLEQMQDTTIVLYAAEVVTKPCLHSPESPLARVWHECLGARAIPFNTRARKALIEIGRQHAELTRHIVAWEEMKRSGSQWLTV